MMPEKAISLRGCFLMFDIFVITAVMDGKRCCDDTKNSRDRARLQHGEIIQWKPTI